MFWKKRYEVDVREVRGNTLTTIVRAEVKTSVEVGILAKALKEFYDRQPVILWRPDPDGSTV